MSGYGVGGWPGRHSSREVSFWREREIKRLWREACESHGYYRRISTPTGWTLAVPSIGTVTLGEPTVLTVRLGPGQRIERLRALANEIAEDMGVPGLRVSPMPGTWVRVELLAPPHRPLTPVPPAGRLAPPPPAGALSAAPAARRLGPSRAWTSRWHPRRLRRPQQPG